MKKILPVLFWAITSVLLVHAEWTTDYKDALAQAKQQNKLVLLDFTGSDWCGYCKLLDKEVFTDSSFKNFASKNFLSVTVDFPHGTKLSDALTQQNDQLQQQFKIDGFPTLIVVDPDGKELGRMTGYDPGSGPKAVISQLQGYIKK
jgi:thioredoxin-related protein